MRVRDLIVQVVTNNLDIYDRADSIFELGRYAAEKEDRQAFLFLISLFYGGCSESQLKWALASALIEAVPCFLRDYPEGRLVLCELVKDDDRETRYRILRRLRDLEKSKLPEVISLCKEIRKHVKVKLKNKNGGFAR